MKSLLVKVRTHKNPKLDDDKVVEECMAALQEQHPSITGYTYERVGDQVIQILMWGDFEIVE